MTRLIHFLIDALEPRRLLSTVALHARTAPPAEPDDFVYQLQNVDLVAMGRTTFDLAVIDYSKDGTAATQYSARQIRHLRNSPGGSKTVLSYLSIGEAEDYRFYWNQKWDANHDGKPDRAAPSWLGPENPDWPGNYKVKYWDPAWQKIVYQYVDTLVSQGFSGVYLDVIDAYQFWGPGGESGLNRVTAEQEMVELVKAIAHRARHTDGAKSFLVYVQNAEELGTHADYLAAVNGIGKEDTWYNDNAPNAPQDIADSVMNLNLFAAAGKPVLCIDYVTQQNLIDDFYQKAHSNHFAAYTSDRGLDELNLPFGHLPD